ncbi:MAG: glycosyltransferase family 39 protein [Bacteroidetes bacterium]|nr:glycosyltransferase family 39 protein [Bacteroidota bacterium]
MFQRLVDWADRLLIPVLFLMAITFSLRMHRGWEIGKILWSDGEGYYMYLPATFIYGSWNEFDGQDGLQQIACCKVNESGKVVTRYTYGVALLQTPFFAGAHAWASVFQGPGTAPPADWGAKTDQQWSEEMNQRKYTPLRGQATGFSDTYARGILVAAAFYMALGLWFLKRALRRIFRKEVALATTGLVFLATNLFYYTAGEGSMSHVYSFCLFAAVLYHLPEWLREKTWSRSLILGICFGLILLIRPTNLMLGLMFPLWAVFSFAELKLRLKDLIRTWQKALALMFAAVLVVVPQAFYWKSAFGSWIVWSYGNEGFTNWNHPEILKVLFSYQNGLFLYTPVMLLAMVGIVLAWKKRAFNSPVILLLFVLATYTFASWWAWWFGGAFGHRCYVEFYALLAIPLAVVVQKFFEARRMAIKIAGLVLAMVFVYANVKMAMMYSPPWDGNAWNWESYVTVWRGVAKLTWWPGF